MHAFPIASMQKQQTAIALDVPFLAILGAGFGLAVEPISRLVGSSAHGWMTLAALGLYARAMRMARSRHVDSNRADDQRRFHASVAGAAVYYYSDAIVRFGERRLARDAAKGALLVTIPSIGLFTNAGRAIGFTEVRYCGSARRYAHNPMFA